MSFNFLKYGMKYTNNDVIGTAFRSVQKPGKYSVTRYTYVHK